MVRGNVKDCTSCLFEYTPGSQKPCNDCYAHNNWKPENKTATYDNVVSLFRKIENETKTRKKVFNIMRWGIISIFVLIIALVFKIFIM